MVELMEKADFSVRLPANTFKKERLQNLPTLLAIDKQIIRIKKMLLFNLAIQDRKCNFLHIAMNDFLFFNAFVFK